MPDWVPIYFARSDDDEYKCNLCLLKIAVDKKHSQLLEHIQSNHREVYDIHKENGDIGVGFRIEYLNLNVVKEDENVANQPLVLGEEHQAEAEVQEVTEATEAETDSDAKVVEVQVKKKSVRSENVSEKRKRSWVWKYFDKLSNIIFRCNMCHSVLSIKGCNTNNMNRHVRTRHPSIYKSEMTRKRASEDDSLHDFGSEVVDPSTQRIEKADGNTTDEPGDDVVQCVPTKKGHQILYKGYTYVFKCRLQCGAEQWCCSYRQKTGCISIINMQEFGVEVIRDFQNHKKPMFAERL